MTPSPVHRRRRRFAGKGGGADGAPSHQAASGHARRADGRHRQPRQSDARAGEPVRATRRRRPAAIQRSASRVMAAFGKQHWAPHVNVVVKNGVAELWGIDHRRTRTASARRRGRERRRRQRGARSSGLGRADVRHGVPLGRGRSQEAAPAARRRSLIIAPLVQKFNLSSKSETDHAADRACLCQHRRAHQRDCDVCGNVAFSPVQGQPTRRCRRRRSADLCSLRTNCSRCHAIDKVGGKPVEDRAAVPHAA